MNDKNKLEEHKVIRDQEEVAHAELSEIILIEGKKHRKRRVFRTGMYGAMQATFVTALTLSRLGLNQVSQFFLPIVSIPLEFIHLVAEVKNLLDNEKPWWSLVATLSAGLFSIIFLGILDAARFGSTSAFVSTFAVAAPYMLMAVFSFYAALNLISFISSAHTLYKNPACRSPVRKFGLANKVVKTMGLIVIAALIVPFMAAILANPVGASIMLAVMCATAVTLLVMKLVKTRMEDLAWEKTIKHLIQADKHADPYHELFTSKQELHAYQHKLIQEGQEEQRKTIFQKIKNIFTRRKAQDKSANDLLQEALTKRVAQVHQQSAMGQIDEFKKRALILELQNIYDLLRKPRGRLKYQEAIAYYHTHSPPAAKVAPGVEEALEEKQHKHPIFQGEPGFQAKKNAMYTFLKVLHIQHGNRRPGKI